ncbi:MAG TPA: SAM-dependent methyltransferase [Candidatus Butyricimonas faecavium]|nr:SAM-dependent methyltransferase [Candidatus Butyricimonas faecavium]
MPLNPDISRFIREHLDDDPDQLLWKKNDYPDDRVVLTVQQIQARENIKEKLPSWYACRDIFYPSKLSTEQCSSEITALYKVQLAVGNTLCDLTGGLGVDTYFFSRQVSNVTYVERNDSYCEAARSNFLALGATNIEVIHADANTVTNQVIADTYYIDPARRTTDNKRVFALTDYAPNVLEIKEALLQQGQRLIIKISPMADLSAILQLLPETTEVHVVSVRNECKELLFILDKTPANQTVNIHTVNFATDSEQLFSFPLEEEKNTQPRYTNHVGTYLYEPNCSILKSGAFKLVANRYGLEKLHPHSHLYTSDHLVEDFPGRSFHVKEVLDFSSKLLKQISHAIPKANITTRNFKLSVNELRSRSKIKDGGTTYLFATTLNDGRAVIVRTEK